MVIKETVESVVGHVINLKVIEKRKRLSESWQRLQSSGGGTFRDCVVFFDSAEHGDLYGPQNIARRKRWALHIKRFLEKASDDTVEQAVQEISVLFSLQQQRLFGEAYATLHEISEISKDKNEDFGWLDRCFGGVVAMHRAAGETDINNFQKELTSSSIPRRVIEDNFPEIRKARLAWEAAQANKSVIPVNDVPHV